MSIPRDRVAEELDLAREEAYTSGWPVLKYLLVEDGEGPPVRRAFLIGPSRESQEVPPEEAPGRYQWAMRATARRRKEAGLSAKRPKPPRAQPQPQQPEPPQG